MNTTNFAIQQVDFQEIHQYLEPILEFSTKAFLENHAITREAYSKTSSRDKHTFIWLFKEAIADMVEEIERQKGYVFIAKNQEKIIAISMGRVYGRPAFSEKFMQTVAHSSSCFREVMKHWSESTEKFQVQLTDQSSVALYHQALIAVDPHHANKSVETGLSEFIMKFISSQGFVALLKENSFLINPDITNGIIKDLKEKKVETICLENYPHLMTGKHNLHTNENTQKIFKVLEELQSLKEKTLVKSTQQKIVERIDELEIIIKREINGPDHMGGTPVQGASHANDVQTLRKLIAKGANLSLPEPFYGGTVLHVAVDGRSYDCVKEILNHAPHLVHQSNRNGVTALAWAHSLQQMKGGFKEIINLLKEVKEK